MEAEGETLAEESDVHTKVGFFNRVFSVWHLIVLKHGVVCTAKIRAGCLGLKTLCGVAVLKGLWGAHPLLTEGE